MSGGLPESVDHDIAEGRTIVAIKGICDSLGCSIREAVDIYAARHEELLRDRPTISPSDRTNSSPCPESSHRPNANNSSRQRSTGS
ncbi:hypothetical protein G3I60_10705 [Streptomyces sp. SID13666]|uniref:hypothetical protein n=1 Tax=Streptomyces TaxID=1883 RepID=UPI0013C0C13F|nr:MULTISPECIES: hypothetical protein [unclassified Streptomyces]NEA54612.1 hypothetical protein [Streptomyces sp. SID13666]NEA70401.1 hypothetical protein [Streptomyces sp. SID13588]QNA70566.1 hypothetical protein C8250_040100 [Streptomyces sp. So13.3]